MQAGRHRQQQSCQGPTKPLGQPLRALSRAPAKRFGKGLAMMRIFHIRGGIKPPTVP